MPAYNSLPYVPAIYTGNSFTLFSAESTATITTSQQVALGPDPGSSHTACVVEGFFSGDPGSFEADIQFADTDADAYYIAPSTGGKITTTTGSPNWHFSYQYDAPGTLGCFVRALMKTNGNTVNLTLKVTR